MNIKKKPSAVKGLLTPSEDEEERQFLELNKEFIADTFKPLGAARRKLWEKAKLRKPGRPRVGKGVRVISLSVEKGLLAKADAAAKSQGISRAELFARGVRSVLTSREGSAAA